MKKRKIAIYNLNTYPEMSGGSERSCIELAQSLIKQGEDVAVVTLDKLTKGFQEIKYKKIPIYKIPLLNIYWPSSNAKKTLISKLIWNVIDIANLPMAFLICAWLKINKFTIVHTNNIKGASVLIFPLLRIFRIKVVHTTRDFYLLDGGAWYRDINDDHNYFLLKLKRLIKRNCSRFIDHVVFNSKYMMEYHKKCGYFSDIKCNIIYNGFDTSIYSEVRKNKKNEVTTFGYIGRFGKEKGVDLLVDNFIKFPEGKYNLIIAGGVIDDFAVIFPEKINVIKSRKDIIFLGKVDNIEFYKSVDCVIVPSKYNEPFGRVAMEAIFMGKFVIVSNKGGLPEQILNNVDGLVCDDDDYYKSMCNIISKCNAEKDIEDKKYLDVFTMDHCSKEYIKVFKQVSHD